MDPQTIAIIAVGATLLVGILAGYGLIVPLLAMIIRRVDNLSDQLAQTNRELAHANRVVTALSNHRHSPDGEPTFTVPAD